MQIGSPYPLNGSFAAERDVAIRSRAENFPVASRVLPKRVRSQLMAVYGFARLTDDLGDEADGDRLQLLDWLSGELEQCRVGAAGHPVLQRLQPLITEHPESLDELGRLIEANRMDQRVHRYESFEDLLGYCMLSAAPVGRLVLQIFGAATPERIAWSDDVCIGLQVVEHLQDVREDAERGRVYLPSADLAAFGCSVDELTAGSATPALRRLLAMEADRAVLLLGSAAALGRSLPLRPRLAVCGFAGGGLAAVDSIRQADYDVLAGTCRPRRRRLASTALHLLVSRVPTTAGAGAIRGCS